MEKIRNTNQKPLWLKKSLPPLTILIVAGIFLIPQLLQQAMIISSDSIFHFNRFYDTAMQMKNGNFQYFISMYGFQESGRIVNALYGPFMAYFQGLLVLLSPSWFFYQLLSNYLLYCVAGLSMFIFLKKARIKNSYSLLLSLFYITTYSIQYWTLRQGFSSWGAALFPLCLLPIIDFAEKKEIYPVKLGILVALMFQTHILSSLFLVLVYLPFFLYAFFTTNQKVVLLRNLFISVSLFFLLTLNVTYSFIQVYGKNMLVEPFINHTMDRSTIFENSSYWLWTPTLFVPLLLFFLFEVIRSWKQTTALLKLTLFTAAFFFFLCANTILWKLVQTKGMQLIELIQFPFRFFIPFTVLFLLGLGLILQKNFPVTRYTKVAGGFILLFSIGQTLQTTNVDLNKWQSEDSYIQTGKHTIFFSSDSAEIKASFFDNDLSKALHYVEKATPDYLPWTNKSTENKYNAYTKQIVKNQKNFKKYVKGDELIVEWSSDTVSPVTVPVIKYADTNIEFNKRDITKSNVRLTTIGVPVLQQKIGRNQLILRYPHQQASLVIVGLTIVCWLFAISFVLIRKRYKTI